MKYTSSMRFSRLTLILLTALVAATACQNKTDSTTTDSSEQARRENDVKFDNKKQEKDAEFLLDATAFYLRQIKLGELAARSGRTAVKGLQKDLQPEHDKGLKEVREMAKSKQVSIPDTATADAASTYQMLSAKTSLDFDKAYTEDVVDSYKKIVASFEKEAADSRDQDIKDWAKGELPNLRKQLDHIFECQKKL